MKAPPPVRPLRSIRSHAEKDGFSLGAEFLPKKQASKVFVADVNSCCLVVQMTVYPEKDDTVDLSLFDFSLVEVKTDNPVAPGVKSHHRGRKA